MSMKTTRTGPTVSELIADINKRLDNIECLTSWLVKAEHRFRVGQRVEFSAAAERAGLTRQRKGGVRTGKVVGVSGFTVDVLLDGYKKSRGFQHGFFVLSSKRKKTP